MTLNTGTSFREDKDREGGMGKRMRVKQTLERGRKKKGKTLERRGVMG